MQHSALSIQRPNPIPRQKTLGNLLDLTNLQTKAIQLPIKGVVGRTNLWFEVIQPIHIFMSSYATPLLFTYINILNIQKRNVYIQA